MIITTKITPHIVMPVIKLGRQGENEARQVWFDLSWLIETYGEGTATVLHQRSKDDVPYLATLTQDGQNAIWRLTNLDTAYDGYGKCELRWTVGDTLAKSTTFKTVVLKSMTQDTVIPEPYESWYDQMISYIDERSIAPDQIDEAVAEYLDEHPVEAPVNSVNGKTGAVVLDAAGVGAIGVSDLSDAIDTALAQAKASGEFDGVKGDKGDKGDPGEQGPQGIQGEQGPKGDTGETGPQGVKGDTGATGPQGNKGDKGDKGDTGDTGPKGEQGDKGDSGALVAVTVSGTSPTIIAEDNKRYICGEVTFLSFTPCASGICDIQFTSGSTAALLTVPSTVKFPDWFDPTSLETNTVYEMNILDGVYGVVMSWAV